MNLYIDIGNTATKFGVDYKEKVELVYTISTSEGIQNPRVVLDSIPGKFNHVYISSVVPEATKVFSKIFAEPVTIISPLDDSGVQIKIDYPEELGTDLLCDIAGCNELSGYPSLIIDLGTATKFLFVDENGVFSTCAIVPGIELSLNTLNKNTALLPRIDIQEVKPILDLHNTKDVLMSSVFYSHIDMINGMVNRYKEAVSYPFQIVITGGHTDFIKDYLNFEYKLKYNLCLHGLKSIAKKKEE